MRKPLIFWGLAILGAVNLLGAIATVTGKGKKEETALDILKKRYAKGEITGEEFEKIKSDVMKS